VAHAIDANGATRYAGQQDGTGSGKVLARGTVSATGNSGGYDVRHVQGVHCRELHAQDEVLYVAVGHVAMEAPWSGHYPRPLESRR